MRKWMLAGAAALAVAFTALTPAQAEYQAEHRGGSPS